MLAVGARFDDRISLGRLDAFAPHARYHIDIYHSCINKIVKVAIPFIGDVMWLLF